MENKYMKKLRTLIENDNSDFSDAETYIRSIMNDNDFDSWGVAQLILELNNNSEQYQKLLMLLPSFTYDLEIWCRKVLTALNYKYSIEWAKSPNVNYGFLFEWLWLYNKVETHLAMLENPYLSTEHYYFLKNDIYINASHFVKSKDRKKKYLKELERICGTKEA